MKTLILALSFILTGCGVGQNAYRTPTPIDPAFSQYIQGFQDHYMVSVGSVGMGFKPASAFATNIIGYCDGINVSINSTYWATADDTEKMLLVYHELGHCVLGHGHDKDTDPVTGCPLSVMNPYLPNDYCYLQNPAMLDTYRLNP